MGPPTIKILYTQDIHSPAFWVGKKGDIRELVEWSGRALIQSGSAVEYKGKEEKDVK